MHGIWLAWRLLASQKDYLLYYLWHKGKMRWALWLPNCGPRIPAAMANFNDTLKPPAEELASYFCGFNSLLL